MLETTIAGSLPKPAWLATPNVLWAPWRLPAETLAEGKRDAYGIKANVAPRTAGPPLGQDVLVGVMDVATERVETPDEVAATIRRAMEFVPPSRLYPCTNCGMAPLPREVARGKLSALGQGAARVRAEVGAEVGP